MVPTSNGNDYTDGYYTVVTPAVAKNCISVGATGSDSGSSKCVPSPCSASNLFAGSSKGFTLDERMKPDLVAPGMYTDTA